VNKTQEEMLKDLMADFDSDAINTVQGYDYIRSHYIIKRLIDVFGIKWSSETIQMPIVHEDPISGKQWLAMGVRFSVEIDGKSYCKDGWDAIEIKTYTDKYPNGQPNPKAGYIVDLGNNYKACYTSALKKAVTQVGIGLYLYFGGILPDDEFGYAEEEPVEIQAPKKEKMIPSKPEWGGDEPIFDTPKAKKGYSANKKVVDDFFQAPKSSGVGLSKGSNTVSASVTAAQSKPNVFSLNAVLNGFKDLISAGTIESKPLEEMIFDLTGFEGIDDIHKLTQEEAYEIIQNQKKLLGNR